MDTENLVKKAKSGDDQSFYILIDDNKEKLYKIAYSYFGNETDSLEAIQETTYRAYLKIKKLKEPKYFNTWLIRILINYCIDELKRKNRMVLKEVDQVSSDQLVGTSRLEIENMLSQLKPKYKSIIILKYFHDLTIHEISLILKRPEGTIKTWLNKALNELRQYQEKDGDRRYV